jgi:disulfide bond formation protein DsbB
MKELPLNLVGFLRKNYLPITFVISFLSLAGSLYYSEVIKLTPCDLCWYQRIFMYPMAFLALSAMVTKIELKPQFLLVLSVPGMLIALYQYILQMSSAAIASSLLPCTFNGCAQIQVIYLGFITIPLMSFMGFALITLSCLLSWKETKKAS